MKIFLVDDEKEIADLIELYLKNEGYDVIKCSDGKTALEKIRTEVFDLAILDVMLPDVDGFTLCREIRKKYNFPVIMLTARTSDDDKISGLTLGADDYVTKPFNPLELIARVKSQIRRFVTFSSAQISSGTITTGNLTVDTVARKVTLDDKEIRLTATEYKIVEYLMQNMGRTLSSAQIYEHVWNEDAISSDKTVTVHIRRIREKIEIDTKNPMYIKVVWGIGYKIEKI